MASPTTTFYTAANKAYEPFALPYIISTLIHNDDAVVNIGLENPERFKKENSAALAILTKKYNGRFEISKADFSRGAPNTVRFIEDPKIQTLYTYIGDIDILILENVSKIHIKNMIRTGLPYSNIIRPNGIAMSGLHFTLTTAYYPQEEVDESQLNLDEKILFMLVKANGDALPLPDEKFRPLHGYHLSLSRRPSSKSTHWGLFNPSYLKNFIRFINTPFWQDILPHLDIRYRRVFAVMLYVLETKNPDLANEIELLKNMTNYPAFRQALLNTSYDFLHFGCGSGRSIELAETMFKGRRGLGVDINLKKVELMRQRGYEAEVCDATNLTTGKSKVRFCMLSHFLEHLSGINSAERCIRSAIDAARSFIFIQQPYFDADGYLLQHGYKLYWSDWHGHPNHMSSLEFHNILSKLQVSGHIDGFAIFAAGPIWNSTNPALHPVTSPQDQQIWDAERHPPKSAKKTIFTFPVFHEIKILVNLNGFDAIGAYANKINWDICLHNSSSSIIPKPKKTFISKIAPYV